MNASVIDDAAKAGHKAYFNNRPGHVWDVETFPTVRTWTLMTAKVLNGELTSARSMYEWYIDVREAKGWLALGTERRRVWEGVYGAILTTAAASVREAA